MSEDEPDVTDRDLFSRHVAGDPEAFGRIVRRHQDRLWAVALRTLGDEDEAADALQDALVSAFRKAPAFRGDAAVTTWLHRIVVNACLDRARRRSARPVVPLSEATETGSASIPDPTLAWAESRDVTDALAQLPIEQRTALVLVDMEGYSIDETARILEVAPGTIKSRCARGRARLAPILTGRDEEHQPGGGRNRTGSTGVSSRQGNDRKAPWTATRNAPRQRGPCTRPARHSLGGATRTKEVGPRRDRGGSPRFGYPRRLCGEHAR